MAYTSRTHRLAVNSYILKGDVFLLLKRVSEPRIWTPPGGRLEKDENPLEGLKREVLEETSLSIDILMPANIWFGKWQEIPLLSIDFLTVYRSGNVRLSEEHSEYCWVTLEEMQCRELIPRHSDMGFELKNFVHALKLKQFFDLEGKVL
ncbi:MAG: NUDIX domain-containing protein [Calditrichaeota bacterium]|nr:NUDIX domain-containing protein [Calditrichota bacterium]RQW08168.1 MAG: NUDIX domain-containing protein [Calditrichota bacterium]